MNEMQAAAHDSAVIAESERCRHWMEAALKVGGNTHDYEDVEDMILSGRAQLWSAEDGCTVTEVVEYPNCRHLHIWLCGGSLERIMDMLPDIERFAEYIGAAAVTSCGRHGWAKMLAPHGYSKGMLSVNKPLTITVKRPEGES